MTSLSEPTGAVVAERPQKRRREGEQANGDASSSGADVEKSTRFWFRDGTVVIQAANTQFRIHWGILSARSDFFNDMFSIPQPANEPTIEGCPVVVVHDTVEDWEILLNVLYYPSPVHDYERDLVHYVSILRLGRKYGFADFADVALDHMKTKFAWVGVGHGLDRIHGLTTAGLYKWAGVVEELGIQILLPAMYYLCLVSLSLIDISDGLTLENGPTLTLPPKFRRMLLIHRDEFTRKLKTQWDWMNFTASTTVPARACSTRQACVDAFEIKQDAVQGGDIAAMANMSDFTGMCDACRTAAHTMAYKKFNHFFTSDMLRLFELPPRGELSHFAH